MVNFLFNVDLLIMLIYSTFLLWIVFRKKFIFLKYFYFWFVTSWQIISVYAVENITMYMPNLKLTSYHTGALFPLVLTNIIAFSFLIVLDEGRKEKYNYTIFTRSKKIIYLVLCFFIVMTVFLFLCDIFDKNYYVSGAADRFYYGQSIKAISFKLYGYLMFLFPFLTINAEKNGKHKILWIFISLYTLYILLIGQKFGPFLQILYFLLLTYFLPFKSEFIKKNYLRTLVVIGTFGLIMLIFSGWQMSLEKGSISAGLIQLQNRILNGQGDIWWGIYSRYNKGGLHLSELSDELGAFHSGALLQQDWNFGIYKMMNLVAPSSVVLFYAQRGARFTASTDATLYYYFGLIGLILIRLFLMYIMYFLTNGLVDKCRQGYGLAGMAYVWLMAHFLRIFYMSSYELFVCKSAFLCYSLLIYNQIVGRKLFLDKFKTRQREIYEFGK